MTEYNKNMKRLRWGRVGSALLIMGIFLIGLVNVFQYVQGAINSLSQPLEKVEANDSPKKAANKKDGMNVLLLGSDSRGEKHSRTDTIMVAHYNPQTHDVKLISLMRDMYVFIPEHGQQKLNAAYTFGGTQLLRETILLNFGLDIDHYAIVDFKGFESAVDLLVPNGIEVDIPYEMSDGIGMTLEQGRQKLNGRELLGYVRFREDRLSDFGRVERQQEVVSKLKEEAVSLHSVVKVPELLKLLDTYIETNIKTSTLLAMGKDIMTNDSGDIQTLRLPEEGSFQNKRYEGIGDVLEIDLKQNKIALNKFLGK